MIIETKKHFAAAQIPLILALGPVLLPRAYNISWTNEVVTSLTSLEGKDVRSKVLPQIYLFLRLCNNATL